MCISSVLHHLPSVVDHHTHFQLTTTCTWVLQYGNCFPFLFPHFLHILLWRLARCCCIIPAQHMILLWRLARCFCMVEVPGVSQLTAIGSILVCSRNIRSSISNVVIASTMIKYMQILQLEFQKFLFLEVLLIGAINVHKYSAKDSATQVFSNTQCIEILLNCYELSNTQCIEILLNCYVLSNTQSIEILLNCYNSLMHSIY